MNDALSKEQIMKLRQRYEVHVQGFGHVHDPELEPLFKSYLELVAQLEEAQKTLEQIQSRCAENSSIWSMAERGLTRLRGDQL